MSRKKQQRPQPVRISPAHLSRLAQQRKRQRFTLLFGVLAIALVLVIVGFGYFYTSIFPRWEAVATVDGTPVSAGYYAKMLRLYAGPTASAGLVTSVTLSRIIDDEIFRQRAPGVGITVTPQEIDEYLQVPAESDSESEELRIEREFRRYLLEVGFSAEELRRIAEVSLLRRKALDHFIAEGPKEAEQVHLFTILVDTEEQAQQVVERLDAGDEFSTVAQELSLDPVTREKGGEIGWVPRGVLFTEELAEAAFTLEPGSVGDPIVTSQGRYIIKVEGKEVRALSEDSQKVLGADALQLWLEKERESSEIENSLTPRLTEWAVSWASR